MLSSGMLDSLPMWVMFPLTIVCIALATEAGYRLGRRRGRRPDHEKEAPVGGLVAAMLALLGLLLAFTFSIAASRFESRREVLLEESNAIGTAYLRTSFLPKQDRDAARQLYRDYVDARLEAVRTGDLAKVLERSSGIHAQLWSQVHAAGESHPDSESLALYIQALNEVIDLHSKRLMIGVRNRVPEIIILVLYMVTFLSVGTVGYHSGLSGTTRSGAAWAFLLTLAIVIYLIIDLDRPREGLFRVSQQAMIDLRESMRPAK